MKEKEGKGGRNGGRGKGGRKRESRYERGGNEARKEK